MTELFVPDKADYECTFQNVFDSKTTDDFKC